MNVNDIVIVSDEFETTNGYHFGRIGRVTRINNDNDYPINVTFLRTNEIEIFHESELAILGKGEMNGGN